MKHFASRSQADWGVPPDIISPLNWQNAIFELNGLEHNLTPSTQLHMLTRTVKSIYSEFKLAVLPRLLEQGKQDVCVAADDLVPLFMYIFCQSNLRHPIRSRDLMWSLCHPDQLHGEAGYYLTVYESAIEFILNEPVSSRSFVARARGDNPLNPIHGREGGSIASIDGMIQRKDTADGSVLTTGSKKSQLRSSNWSVINRLREVVGYESNYSMRESFAPYNG